MSSRSAVFLRMSNFPIPRVMRMMNVARSLGYDTRFLAARRDASLPLEDVVEGHSIVRVGGPFPLLNGRSLFVYLRGVFSYNIAAFQAMWREKPDIVHCSDIETMPAAVLLSLFRRFKLIYNVHDNLAERYDVPRLVSRGLNILEGCAVLLSSSTLVPEQFRCQSLPAWCRSKISVIRNTPEDRGWIPPPPFRGPLRLFFGGWLDSGRGIRKLLSLVRHHENLHLTIAGDGDERLVDEIKRTPRVRFLGFLDHDSIMRETANCHVVVALYDPVRPINRHAASNKLAEALSVGRPVFVNAEMLIVRDLREHDCLIVTPYSEVESTGASLLLELLSQEWCVKSKHGVPGRYSEMCLSARRAYEEFYSWEVAKSAMTTVLEHPDKVLNV